MLSKERHQTATGPLLANRNDENVSTYQITKRVGLVVTHKEATLNEQTIDIAEERIVISVAVKRKQTTAIYAIRNVLKDKFG